MSFDTIKQFLPYPLTPPNPPLYHFEVIINPHNFAENDVTKGVFFKIMYKLPYTDNYVKEVENVKYQYGDELLGLVQTMLDRMGTKIQLLIVQLT